MDRFYVFRAASAAFLLASPAMASIAFQGDFETGNISQYDYYEGCCSYSSNVVTSPVRTGKYAHRIELRKSDPIVGASKRVELSQYNAKGPGGVGDERWFGFSVFLPADWIEDNRYAGELVWQVHNKSDSCETSALNPPAALIIDQGNWVYSRRSDSNACSIKGQQPSNDHALGAIEKGKWTDWVIHVKWSYGSDGITQIWKNGALLVDHRGPNYYNDQADGYMKFGLYKWGWSEDPAGSIVNTRVLYHDEMRIGDSGSSYAEVAPQSSAPAPSPSPTPTASPTPSPSVSPISGNLVVNPSFESGSQGWELWENTSVVATQAVQGTNSLRTGTGAGGARQFLSISPVAGSTYELSAWGRVTVSGDRAGLYFDAVDANNATITRKSLNVTQTTYQQFKTSLQVPAGTSRLVFWYWKDAGTGYFHLDDVSVTELGAAPAPSPSPTPTSSPTPAPSPSPTATVAPDTTPPSVTLTAPTNGSTVAVRSTLTMTANATDNVQVARVLFYVNGSLKCTDTTASYSCAWKVPNKRRATYQIRAQAYDTAGNTASSAEVTITSQ